MYQIKYVTEIRKPFIIHHSRDSGKRTQGFNAVLLNFCIYFLLLTRHKSSHPSMMMETLCASQIIYISEVRQPLGMPYFSIVTNIFTTQWLMHGKSVLRLFDILGGKCIHNMLENYGFHN